MYKRGRMNGGSRWYSWRTTPHLLSHFAISVGSVDLMEGLGIESRSAILLLGYLVPSPPPFAASDEIHRVCFRRWVRLGCRCLCTQRCGSTRRRVFVVETADGGGVAFYATVRVSSNGGVSRLRTTHQFVSPVQTRRGWHEPPKARSRQVRVRAVRSTNRMVANMRVRCNVRVSWQLS